MPSPSPWYVRRALRIARQRLLYRLNPQLIERKRFLSSAIDWGRIGLKSGDDSGLVLYSRKSKFRSSTRYLVDEEDLAWFKNRNPYGNHRKILSEADKIRQHRIRLAGSPRIELGTPIGWNRDPVTGSRFPSSIFSVFPDPRIDSRLRIELNLHRHFTILATAWNISGNSTYATELLSQLVHWMRFYPPVDDNHINDGLENSIRIFSWTHCLFLLSDFPIDRVIYTSLLARIHRLTWLVEKNYNAGGQPNNHQIGEAFCLFFVGLLYPEFEISSSWIEKGINYLKTNLQCQFLPGGVHAEQSSSYHLFVLEIYILTLLLAIRNNITLDKEFQRKIEEATEYVQYITKPDFTYPQIGDEGFRFFCPTDTCIFRASPFLALGATIFKRPDMAKMASFWSEDAFWRAGRPQFFADLLRSETSMPESRKIFQAAGHLAYRSEWTSDAFYVHFDFGPHGLGSRAGHAHDDALSFEFHALGEDLVVDTGTYTYVASDPLRGYFRSARGHNAILLDGNGPARLARGQFGWEKTVTPELRDYGTNKEITWLSAAHSAFSCDASQIEVERSVLITRDRYILLIDRISGSGEHTIETLLHLHPNLNVQANERPYIFIGTKAILEIRADFSSKAQTTLHIGEDPDLPGWFSPSYGTVLPAPVVRFCAQTQLPYFQVTALIPHLNPDYAITKVGLQLRKEPSSGQPHGASIATIGLENSKEGWVDTISVNWGSAGFSVSTIETDARFVLLSNRGYGQKAWIFGETYFRAEGKLMVEHLV